MLLKKHANIIKLKWVLFVKQKHTLSREKKKVKKVLKAVCVYISRVW